LTLHTKKNIDDETLRYTTKLEVSDDHQINRRTVMTQTMEHAMMISSVAAGGVGAFSKQLPAFATTTKDVASSNTEQQQQPSLLPTVQTAQTPSSSQRITNSAVVCDSTISVWTISEQYGIPSNIYLLGTAHISDISASLAGALVRQVHPDAVFVELDIKRIQNLPTMPMIASKESSTQSTGDVPSSSTKPAILVPSVAATSSYSSESTMSVASSPSSSSSMEGNNKSGIKQWFQRRVLNLAGAAVGKGIQSMYSDLSTAGFQPGEEFAEAIRAGREINATIVLGDQDVQITLRRLAEALSMTDMNQLLNPDSKLEQTMSNLLPSVPQAMNGTSVSSSTMSTVNDDPTQFKRELSDFVEQMKSRETVRTIIQELKGVAPEIVRVMLTERDKYMANGLHTLRQSYPNVVAVMGLAHMDGVERNLRELGWNPVQLTCPK
jgi:TraB/PrgY/gumN family